SKTDIQHIAPNNTNLPPTIQIYKPIIIINNNKHPFASTSSTHDIRRQLFTKNLTVIIENEENLSTSRRKSHP
ncbi:hypothetical protein M8C21_016290, partial [Ambrosia artemisiifolia]